MLGQLYSSALNRTEVLTVMCPLDSTIRLGNGQNDTKGFILWCSFLVESVRNANGNIRLYISLAVKLSQENVVLVTLFTK